MSDRLYMGSTRVKATRTAHEVATLLAEAGARSIITDYGPGGQVAALTFELETAAGPMAFRLPVRIEPVFFWLQKQRSPRHRERGELADRAQAANVAWRQILRWIEAQLAIIQTGMVPAAEAFLPYARSSNGQTLYELFADRKLNKLLPAPGEHHG